MASTFNELIPERINDGVDCTSNNSLILRSKENTRSQDETDDPHQAVKKAHETEGRTGRLLSIPLEIRLQIFINLFRADKDQICPHARFRSLFLRPKCLGDFPAVNKIFLAALLINRQLYFEMKPILYSENFFYFEGCLTLKYFDPPSLPQKLLAAIGTYLKQIGFPLKFDNNRSATEEASMKAAKRFKAEFKLLSTHLPNLNTTQVDLFCTYTKPCQRFLVCLVHSCQLLPGKKIITIHSTNREKARIAKILKIHLYNCSDMLLLGGCVCTPFLEWSSDECALKIHKLETYSGGQGWSNNWGGQMIRSYRSLRDCWNAYYYESVVSYDSNQVKGPRIGCLLCKLGTKCVHDGRYGPTRQAPHAPLYDIGLFSFRRAFNDWADQEGDARKGREFRINWDQL